MARILRNLTLHEQQEAYRALTARAGFFLTREAEGVLVGPGEAGLQEAKERLATLLRESAHRGEAVLVGGHTAAWLAAVLALQSSGERLPPLYYFETERMRDDRGRFVFVPDRLLRIPYYRWE